MGNTSLKSCIRRDKNPRMRKHLYASEYQRNDCFARGLLYTNKTIKSYDI